jgi:tetratricopeptide (TPR) repeat protein
VAYERTGQTDRALDYLARALAANPDHRRANESLGLLLAARGEAERAAEHLRRAARPRPEQEDPDLAPAREAIERGRFEEAEALLARAGGTVEADYLRGRILEHASRFAEAVEHYRRAVERAAPAGAADDEEAAGGASAPSVP